MKINVLPQTIANMIAAGEVVERPASVVKELVENSIDAGAKSVTVEIKKGGMSYIRISDDGCGIEPDDVLTAFKRHATSKIRTRADLDAIYTLGFRGEALASIASVAKVDIFTKTKDTSFGYTASIEGGEVTDSGEAGCPDGTTIVVRDLFYNTPARMKFLKNDATETSYVTDIVHKMILSNPAVSIKLIVNGKTTVSSSGDGNLESSVRAVFGRDYISHMNKVSFEDGGIKVWGFVGTNALARKDRRQQVFFINGRYIKSKIISAALSEAYQNVMMSGRFPVAVLLVELMGNFVDVNVHPTKTEVRFSDDKKIYSAVFWAVKNALASKKYVPEIDLSRKREIEDTMKVRREISKEKNNATQVDINLIKDTYIKSQHAEKKEDIPQKDTKPYVKEDTQDISKKIETNTFFSGADVSYFKEEPSSDTGYKEHTADISLGFKVDKPLETDDKKEENHIEKTIEVQIEKNTEPQIKYKANIDFAIAGQIFDTYIIVQKDNEMIIIDQHAAHERIYFEELVEAYRQKEMTSQLLMMPSTVDFDPTDFDIAMQNIDIFSSLGFEIEEFGSSSIIVRSVPYAMREDEIKDTISEIVSHLSSGTKDIKKSIMEEILHTMACKKALKGNTKLGAREMEALCERVLSFDSINTCPHGRPIMTSMTKYELEKNFKRIV